MNVINNNVLLCTVRALNWMISHFPFSSTILSLLVGHSKTEMVGMDPSCIMSWE